MGSLKSIGIVYFHIRKIKNATAYYNELIRNISSIRIVYFRIGKVFWKMGTENKKSNFNSEVIEAMAG